MAANPRRISKIEVVLYLPANIGTKNRKILENTANTCPVMYSVHADIEKDIEFKWDL